MAYWSNSETKALVESWKVSMVEHQLNELPIVCNKFLYMDIVSRSIQIDTDLELIIGCVDTMYM